MFSLSKLVWLVPLAALGVAFVDMPYGYYQLLRVLLFCASAHLAFESQRRGDVSWAWAWVGIAIVYNPFFKLALGRELWEVVNVATVIFFIVHGVCAARTWEKNQAYR